MNPDTFIAPPCSEQIQILFEDKSLLLIDKPSGLLSLSGKNPANLDSVHYRLAQNYPTVKMVHRLDLGTSGVMVLALNKEANTNLNKQFQARTVIKQYMAILFGHLKNDDGAIDAPIAKAEFPYQRVCFKTGKRAQSQYRVLERLVNAVTGIKTTRVLFTPLTGRTHQLRVHSQEIGHPIIGCDLYGSIIKSNAQENDSSIGSETDTHSLANRLALHASSLAIDHPVTGERMVFESSLQLPASFDPV